MICCACCTNANCTLLSLARWPVRGQTCAPPSLSSSAERAPLQCGAGLPASPPERTSAAAGGQTQTEGAWPTDMRGRGMCVCVWGCGWVPCGCGWVWVWVSCVGVGVYKTIVRMATSNKC